MALDTRLIGQALGEGKPVDVTKAVRPAIVRGERAFARTAAIKQQEQKEIKAENQRRESLQARAIAQLKDINLEKVPSQIRDYITKKAFDIKRGALEVIQDKNIDPIAAQLAVQNYIGEINKLKSRATDFKEWQALFVDTSSDDLSNLNTPEILSKVNDIQDGAMELQKNGMFKFKDGSEYSFDDMLKIRHVNKRSDSYMKALGAFEKLGLESGLKGNSVEIFKTKADSEFKQLELTDADYASIAVDYLGMDANTNLGAKIKADFESDGDFDDSGLKEEVYDFVKKNFIKAAETAYSKGNEDYVNKFESNVDTDKQHKSEAKRYVDELNDALSSYDLSMLNNSKIAGKLITGTEIRNGKLYLEYIARTTEEGQEIAELAPIDLNNKNKLKALLQEYIKGQKGMSMSNKISNFISASELFDIAEVSKQNSILFQSPTTKPQLP